MPPPGYRGCWHVVGRGFFWRYRHFRFVPPERGLQPEGLHPPRGVAASDFRPLCKIPCCCLPQESGPCLSPSVADRPLRPATRRRLGGPLPLQLADRPRDHPGAADCFLGRPCDHPRTSGINPSFPGLFRSPGQVSHVLLTRSPLGDLFRLPGGGPSFDLHALGTPPTFVLSQDQTLQRKTRPEGRDLELFEFVV